MVNAADDITQPHFVLNVIDTLPGALGTGAVGRPQEETGDHLQREREYQRAAPDVSPASSTGNWFVQGFIHHLADTGSIVQPVHQRANHTATFSAIPAR